MKITAQIPHSWALNDWPPTVFPKTPSRGRYLVRMYKSELVAAGALTRIGRDLVIFGAEFSRWMQSKRGLVEGFDIAPNKSAKI